MTVPIYLLCQAAAQETRVIFNGENGDQLFGGWTNKPIIAASIYNNQENFTEQYLRTFHRLYGYEKQVFTSAIYQQITTDKPLEWMETALDTAYTNTLLDRLRRATLMLKGSQNIQPRATNLAFAHDLLVRSPFCDLPLTEWTFGLPGEYVLNNAREKYILKRAVESWLPQEIVWRPKRGMGVPLTAWCLDSRLWSEVGYWLNPSKLNIEGHWQPNIAMQIILKQLGGHIRGRRIGELLWLLMMWQAWHQQVLQKNTKTFSLYNPFWLPYIWWKNINKNDIKE